MSGRVYQLHSTLELPLEDVHEYFDSDPELPEQIEDIDITRRNNTLIIHNSGSVSPFLEGSMGEASDWWLKVRGDVLPNQDGAWSLGRSSHRWQEVWAQDGIINTSDECLKKDIADEDLGLEFIEALRPVVWRWKDGSDEVYHRGLIAQQVQEALKYLDSPRHFSGVVDRGGALGLREREFIGPLIKAVQQLSAGVRELEAARPEIVATEIARQAGRIEGQAKDIIEL
ncbi:MAG: tail fiber domain-containing protein, partial [Euryarchaeota archaeon]|nr:tail fiber domain-containing protein [Euryarchaeota archaeon]